MIKDNTYYSSYMSSPVGILQLIAKDNALCGVYFDGKKRHQQMIEEGASDGAHIAVIQKAHKQLDEYFAGKRTVFDLPLAMEGTVFQIKAWKQLQRIPYGQTISYGEQAKRLGDIKKARPVGAANGRNPISIIVPCHRVVGSSGALVGFGGGLKTKSFLLEHEQAVQSKVKRAA